MQAYDLIELVSTVQYKAMFVRKSLLALYWGGTNRVDELLRCIAEIKDKLYSASRFPLRIEKKIVKEVENGIKKGLYRLESLMREIEAFEEEGAHSDMIAKSFVSSTTRELELILEVLKRYSGEFFSSWFVPLDTVVGREYDNQKQKLVELLLDSKSSPVIPILGKPGGGKSTLLRLAINDSRIKNYFTSVSSFNLSFATNEDLVAQAILSDRSVIISKPDSYLKRIQFCADSSRCLLVLEDLSSVEMLQAMLSKHRKHPLYHAFFVKVGISNGSKIIITSSIEHVGASAVSLPSLDNDESWSLFQKIALPNQEKNLPVHSHAVQICLKCNNIPSVIIIIATILSSKTTPEEWKHFADVVMTSVPDPIKTIISALRLTKMLGRCLTQTKWRHCFAWCSLLPQDYRFRNDILFHFWRSQHMYEEYKLTEEEINQCFDEFVRSGFILEDCNNGLKDNSYISYLASELMKHVAGDDYCLVEKPTLGIDHKIIRHVSFIVGPSWQPPSWLPKAKLLQSLLLWPSKYVDFISLLKIDSALSCMRYLHILHAEGVHCDSLPLFLDKCEMLEYLRLGVVSSITFPHAIPVLPKLLNCDPRYIENNENCLVGVYPARLAHLIKYSGIKKLIIQYDKCKEPGSLEETEKIMKSLNVQQIMSSSFDGNGKLKSVHPPHQSLENLEFRCWKGETLPTWATDELSVFIRNLVSIKIANCSGCKDIPAFNTLPHLSSLQLLALYSLSNIVINHQKSEASSTITFYPSLKCLVLCDLPKLKGWSSMEYFFPLLTQVRVQGCPMLISMSLAPMLSSLEATNIDAKLLKDLICPEEPILVSTSSSVPMNNVISSQECSLTQHLSLLETLKLDDCKKFHWGDNPNTNKKGFWGALRNLFSLELTNTAELVSLPLDLEYITTLQQLSLCWLTNLKVLPEWIGLFTQLRHLTIRYCPKLTALPNSRGSFSALEQLEIQYCPRLTQFPKSFPNLKRLQLKENIRFDHLLRASKNLEEVEIDRCEVLDWDTQGDESEQENSKVGVWDGLKRIRSLKVSNISEFEPFSKGLECLTTLENLSLTRMHNLLTLPEWIQNFTKLHRFSIHFCPKLTTLPESLGSLSTLEQIYILYCPKLTKLPESFGNLLALQNCQIQCCPELKELPLSFRHTESLRQLEILKSSQLEERCRYPNGEDWPLIQHIPNVLCGKQTQQEYSVLAPYR